MPQPILTLANLVQTQSGSIVSKELARKPTGTITIFAFDEGQGLSEHKAPFDAIVQIVEGEADIFIDGEAHRLSAGQMIIMPANIPHSLNAVKPFKMLLTMIRS